MHAQESPHPQPSASPIFWGAYLIGLCELGASLLLLFWSGVIFFDQYPRSSLDSVVAATCFALGAISLFAAGIALLGHLRFSYKAVKRAHWYAIAGQIVVAIGGMVVVLFGGSTGGDTGSWAKLGGIIVIGLAMFLLLLLLLVFLYIRRLRRLFWRIA